ncbi:MAG TPA: rhomboid family intramembrane serine protease [Rhabdochlamydiaceae bacterium]|nr:rhomboid family intramembrane serine protease [Rhabdochlamydiaceae bacterium]
MSYTPGFRQRLSATPKTLKMILFSTLAISLVSALCDKLFPYFFGILNPFQILALSEWGIDHCFLWQFFSYLFISPVAGGLSFSLLLSMAFNAYLLWIIGNAIIEKKGALHFLALYFLSGIFTGVCVYWLQSALHFSIPFGGNTSALYSLLIAWIMLYPNLELLLFLTLPIKAKWLTIGLLGSNLLIDLSMGNWLNALALCTAITASYLYCIFVWKVRSPFVFLQPLERILSFPSSKRADKSSTSFEFTNAKIFDFKTGKAILNDEEFMDAMLSKIAMHGKTSLSFRERFRLKWISKRKNTRQYH